MARTYKPRQAARVPMLLWCGCGCRVATIVPPTPDADEGWPLHRCAGRGGRREPFPHGEPTTLAQVLAW